MATRSLLKANNYRDFLECLIAERSGNKKPNFSEMSRRAGFSSRSFIREVLDGKKSLTLSSVAKLKKALGLTGFLAQYFELLVAFEEPAVNVSLWSDEVILEKLSTLKERLHKQSRSAAVKVSSATADSLFMNRVAPEVYASLGTLENGASLAEIQSRSGLPTPTIESVLHSFLKWDVIETRGGRFYLKDPDLDIFNLGNGLNFQSTYLESITKLQRKARAGLNSQSDLFLHTAFSVSQNRAQVLKQRLRDTVIQFLNEEQCDDGEKIAKLTLGLYF
jgi:hypothetical protein